MRKIVLVVIIIFLFGCKEVTVNVPDEETTTTQETEEPTTYQKTEETTTISDIEEYIKVIEDNDYSSMRITFDGVERKLSYYSVWGLDSYIKYYPFTVLTNGKFKSIPPTLIQKGDMFMGFNVKELRCSYTFYPESEIIYFGKDTSVLFEGEIKIKAKLYYGYLENDYLFAIPDDEYQELLPMIPDNYSPYNECKIEFNNANEVMETLNYKYGEYECELTIKDYNLYRDYIIKSTATLLGINVLSEKNIDDWILIAENDEARLYINIYDEKMNCYATDHSLKLEYNGNSVIFPCYGFIDTVFYTDRNPYILFTDTLNIITLVGRGTGCWLEEIYSFDRLTLEQLEIEQCNDIVERDVSIDTDDENFYINVKDRRYTVSKEEIYAELDPNHDWWDLFIYDLICRYENVNGNLVGEMYFAVSPATYYDGIKVEYFYNGIKFDYNIMINTNLIS